MPQSGQKCRSAAVELRNAGGWYACYAPDPPDGSTVAAEALTLDVTDAPAVEAAEQHPTWTEEGARAADAPPDAEHSEGAAEGADAPDEGASSAEALQGSTEDAPPVGNELMELALASQKARLAPAAEERMSALLKEALQSGRAGVARAVEALPKALQAEMLWWNVPTSGHRI